MPKVTIGYGSKVAIGRTTGNTTTFTELTGLKDITLPESTADEIEVTSQDSPNRTKEYISGLSDNGEMSLDMKWIPGSPTDTLLTAIKASGENVQIRYTIVGAASPETYDGFMKGYTRNAPVNGEMTATATFRINGLVTLV